ncbi:MAG TPA: amidohydrolase family protein [Gemmatimonadales bacterium]|nr:amidohydrolase family protein [Gemmatimonadales bacterium]
MRKIPGWGMAAAFAAAPAAAQTKALIGATVIDGTGGPAIANGVVLVSGGRLACVGAAAQCPIPAGAERVDLTGRFLTPGLVDAHVHFSQTGWVDGRPDGLSAPELYPYAETARALRANPARWFRSHLCSGITAVFDVGGHPWTTALPALAEADSLAPHVRAAGPLITHAPRSALNLDEEIYTFLPMATSTEVQASVARLKAMGASAVKVWYLAPPAARRADLDDRMLEVGAAARAANLDLIVHATGLREAKVALRAGAVLLVHSVEDQPVDQEFLDLLAARPTIYAPTLTVGRNATRARVSISLGVHYPVDEAGGCVDPNTLAKVANVEPLRALQPETLRSPTVAYRQLENAGARGAVMAGNLRRVHAAGGTIATATDAGNPLTLHGPSIFDEMEAMHAVGLSASDVIVMSTRNGAKAMGRLAEFGTLEAGKVADLLVLAEDPRADVRAFRSRTHIMRGGRLYPQRALAQR